MYFTIVIIFLKIFLQPTSFFRKCLSLINMSSIDLSYAYLKQKKNVLSCNLYKNELLQI